MSVARVFSLASLALLSGCAAAPPAAPVAPSITVATPLPPAADPLAAKIDPLFASFGEGSPGCAVGVFRAGVVVFQKGYGLANLEHGLPIGARTTFDLGSVSKQFTATAILLLAQDGKLTLDDDIRKHLPELPDYGHRVTLRQLLHHTSGLRDYTSLLDLAGFSTEDLTNDDDALDVIVRQTALDFAPGSKWSYSNTGYFLLSLVVKRTSGEPLSAFAARRIFDPLGMKDTFVLDDHARLVPRRATAYVARSGGGFGTAMSNFEQAGDGAIQTTIEDLARWDGAFYEPAPAALGADWLASMRSPGKLGDGTPLVYGMGQGFAVDNGVAVETHGGAWAGYRAHLRRYPSERLAVAVLCNLGSANPGDLSESVARAMIPALTPARTEGDAHTTETTAPAPPTVDVRAALGAYVEADTFDVRTIATKDGLLTVRASIDEAGEAETLDVHDAHTFVVHGRSVTFTYEAATAKLPPRLVRTEPGVKNRVFERTNPYTPDPKGLSEYAGRYASDEIPRDMQLAVVDGALKLGTFGRTLAIPARPLTKDVFTVGGSVLRFERKAGRVTGMVLSSGRAHGVRYRRTAPAHPPRIAQADLAKKP